MTRRLETEEDFEAMFNGGGEFVLSPEGEARERGKRERSMRGSQIERRHPAWKGERVQFNQKMTAKLKDRVTKACKRHNVSQTDALEQAFEMWLAHLDGGRNA
jgi:hypothetical protein